MYHTSGHILNIWVWLEISFFCFWIYCFPPPYALKSSLLFLWLEYFQKIVILAMLHLKAMSSPTKTEITAIKWLHPSFIPIFSNNKPSLIIASMWEMNLHSVDIKAKHKLKYLLKKILFPQKRRIIMCINEWKQDSLWRNNTHRKKTQNSGLSEESTQKQTYIVREKYKYLGYFI